MSDLPAKFDAFNSNVNEQISKITNSQVDPERLEKIKANVNSDDVFNYQLKSSILNLLDNTVLKASEQLKNKTPRMKASSMNSIMTSNPIGEYFEEFIIELFEIAQSSESLKYTLKYIVDTILRVGKYSSFISSLFLCYLIDANDHSYYPADYAEHASIISEFCTNYLLSFKYSGIINNSDMLEVYTYLQKKNNRDSILNFKTADIDDTFVFSNSYAVVSTGWCLLTHYTEALTQDGSVLVHNTFSDFYKNVIFKNIELCLEQYKISDLDYLDYLIRVLAEHLKKNTKNKIIDKKLRTIVVYLLQSEFGTRNKDSILHSLSKQFSAGVSQVSVTKKAIEDLFDGRAGSNDGRNSKMIALKRDDVEKMTYLNMGFAWVSLIFIHEGLFDLKSLLDEFSKYHNMNDALSDRLSFYFYRNCDDYVGNLREENLKSSESALASATLLTASRDDENSSSDVKQTGLQTSVQSHESLNRHKLFAKRGKDNIMYKIPVKFFPHVLLMSAFLKVQCFKEAAQILASFKYLFLSVDDIEDYFSGILTSYAKEMTGKEKLTFEEKMEKNSYYWLFSGEGKLNLNNQQLSADEFFNIAAITINNGYNPHSIHSLFDSISRVVSHYKKTNDPSYEDILNSLMNCIISQLLPSCLHNSPGISSNIFMLLKHFDAKVRYDVYDTFAKKIVNENQDLKEINLLQQKQIKRFLKVVNVDNLSSQLETLANMVNSNPFVTLSNCLVLAESYDMISNMLVQSMKHFSDFSMDVLEYAILKRLHIERPFISEEEGLALPWFAKICSLITNAFRLHSKFPISEILDFLINKVTNLELCSVFILDSILTGSSNCLYLTDVQDELAILYAGTDNTRNVALQKVGLGQNERTLNLYRLLSKKNTDKSRALLIFESLNAMIFEIFYDSFQTINKINNLYDMVIRVQRLLIDIVSYGNNHDHFANCFDVPNIMINPSFEFVSDAWKALILRKSPRNIQKALLPELANNSLFEFFWYHNLFDLSRLAIGHMPENQRANVEVDLFPNIELKGLDTFHERCYSTEDLVLFLEKCIFKNSILGVAEAIYSAEFIFRVLSQKELIKLLTLIFTEKFISKVVIGISSNESKFFAAFIKRVFMILPSYYETLTSEQLQVVKENVAIITKSFTGELADLILDEEYINCRNSIQILSESVNYLPPIDVFIKVLVDAIEKRLLTENRKELLAPLNAVLGFSKTKLKKSERYLDFSDQIELDDNLREIDEILQLLKTIDEQKLKIKQYDDDLRALESEQTTSKERLLEKKESVEQAASSAKRLHDGEDLRKETKKVKLNYEDDVNKDASKSEATESAFAKKSRFEGFDKPLTEKAASPSPAISLPTEPKSKSPNKLQEQLESPDFKKYMVSKNVVDITTSSDFNRARAFAFLESSLKADTKYMSYLLLMLKEMKLSRVVSIGCEAMQEKPAYLLNGLLYVLIHVFTSSGNMEYKQKLMNLWNQVDFNNNLVPAHELRPLWLKLTNLKTFRYDHSSPYTYVEQIDIHVQYYTTFPEYKLTDERLLAVFQAKKYPESAFERYINSLKNTGRREGDRQRNGRRDGDRQRNGRRDGDRQRSSRRNDGRGSAGYDRVYTQNSRDESESRFSRRQSDRKYYRDSRRY